MKRLIIDASSIGWYCLLAGKDIEFGEEVEFEGKKVYVNHWQYGHDNALNSITTAWERTGIMPKDTILVRESGKSKEFRKRWINDYKESRESRPPEAYEQFTALLDKISEDLRSLGGVVLTRPDIEADDVIAFLVERLKGEKVVMSQDRDFAPLLAYPDVALWRSGELVTENPLGPWDPKLTPIYKALVGDSSDKIPGAKGFGDKAFLNLLAMFGEEGVEEVGRMIHERRLDELMDNVADLKVLSKVVEHKDSVLKSYHAAKLYPDLVEDLHVPMVWEPGYCKRREEIEDARLSKFGGVTKLVHAGNYKAAFDWAAPLIEASEFVSLDIETSTPPESDVWLREVKGEDTKDEDLGVDVIGSELNGLSLTFGRNQNITLYLTCGHADDPQAPNLTVDQVRRFVELVDQKKPIVIHNVNFELPVLFNTWGKFWKDNGWHGFVPNALDTKILSNYVDENGSSGLKKLSERWFGYQQVSYADVTQGRKMNALTPNEVLAYGADDTIMTSALFNFFRVFTEVEQTWDAFEKVEQKASYLIALGFVQGVDFSLETMREIEQEDDEIYNRQREILDKYLISVGWEGTQCPVFTSEDLEVPAKIKEMYNLTLGRELKTMVRKPEKIRALIADEDDENAQLLASFLESGNLDQINDWVASQFDGTPTLDISSPKQMRHLLYDIMGLPVRLVNNVTPTERSKNPELAEAVYTFNKIRRGSKKTEALTDEMKELLKLKATTDKTAVEFALAYDRETHPEAMPVLEAIQELAKITTRRNLFYKKYRNLQHWKTGRIHASMNQCATVTRRFSCSSPNLTQLPKKGEGVKFRRCFVPHKPNAVIVSLDFSGQELRLGADQSGDEAMLACYIGDRLLDIHSLVASGAMVSKWGKEGVLEFAKKYGVDLDFGDEMSLYELFIRVRKSKDEDDAKAADDLRKVAKNVVFGSQYDASALKLSEQLVIDLSEAETFLKAKYARFPRFEKWKEEVVRDLHRKGYVTLYDGARRHLAAGLLSDNKWDIEKAERQGPNALIQGAAASQTKLSMGEAWARGVFFKYDATFFAPIHDELVASVTIDDLIPFIRDLHQCMVIKYLKQVPEVSSISFGPNFGDQYECGDDFDEETILEQLEQIQEAVAV